MLLEWYVYKKIHLHCAGFTLIELLVVIAIIGILASVVLASLQSTRERSRDALRKTQLSEIAKAIEMYHSDNGHYPRTSGWCTQISHPSYQASFWADIAPYMSAPVYLTHSMRERIKIIFTAISMINRTTCTLSLKEKIEAMMGFQDVFELIIRTTSTIIVTRSFD